MENTIIKFFVLWAEILMAAVGLGIIRRHFCLLGFKKKKLYLERFIYYYCRNLSIEKTLEDLYYSLPARSRLALTVKKAIRLCRGPMDKLTQDKKAVEYLGKRMPSYPINLIHGLALSLEEISQEEKTDIPLARELTGLLHEIKNMCIKETDSLYHFLKFQRSLGILAKLVLFLANLTIYFIWREKASLIIFIAINSIGVAVIGLIDITTVVEEPRPEAFSAAFLQWQVLVAALSKEREVKEAVFLSCDASPVEIRPCLKKMIGDMRANPDSVLPYHSLCQLEKSQEAFQCMDILYENRRQKGEDVVQSLVMGLRGYIKALDLSLEEAGRHRAEKGPGMLRRAYQWAGSLGLMVNIMIVLLGLSQAA